LYSELSIPSATSNFAIVDTILPNQNTTPTKY
jgi:hypothetical protein